MILRDYHVHTVFSDGKNTPEETVLAAIEKGFSEIGFSDHSYTDFDTRYCIKKVDIDRYYNEITALKEKYKDKIKVLCGIERDYYFSYPTDRYDYVIGSVHYLKCGDTYIDVDESPEKLNFAANKYFSSDIYALIEEYYRTVADVVNKTGADIIGHFDLISKFIEKMPLFDPCNPRYKAAWKTAADKLLETGAVFEINTGAISRGYRTTPYPANDIMEYLRQNKAKFIFSSDAHSADTIGFGFE